MRKDNRGFSLVEAVLVIAIASILLGMVGIGIGLVSKKPSEECAKKIASVLQKTQRTAVGKTYNEVTITRNAEGDIVVIQNFVGTGATNVETTVVGESLLDVSYTLDGGSSFQSVDTTPLTFSFDRSSGSINTTCTQIRITNRGTRYVNLIPLSGKISVQ